MNARTSNRLLSILVVALCLIWTGSTVAAQGRCIQVKGKIVDVCGDSGCAGTLTNSGLLDGSTEFIFTSGAPLPNYPDTFSVTDDYVITTRHGQLRTSDVGVVNIGAENETYTFIQYIDPMKSTGRFAGATGVLFSSGYSPVGTGIFYTDIYGEVCLAR